MDYNNNENNLTNYIYKAMTQYFLCVNHIILLYYCR